jgi:hypothetical protein
MTIHELADSFERMACALRKVQDGKFRKGEVPKMDGDMQLGAAFLWWYLRDLLTITPKKSFTRDELLVLLDTIQRDADFFTPNVLSLIADAADEEVEP